MTVTIVHYPGVKHCKRCSGMGFLRTKKGSWKLCPICRGYGVDREWVRAIVAWLEGRMTEEDKKILDVTTRDEDDDEIDEDGKISPIYPDHLGERPATWQVK